MSRPIKAIINLKAFSHNLAFALRLAHPAKVMAVVKANAYGHGLERLLPLLDEVDGIALLELEAAVRARELGYKKSIVMLEGFFERGELEMFAEYNLSAVIHHAEQANLLSDFSARQPINIFLKMNSGMNRLGFSRNDFIQTYEILKSNKNVGEIVAMTHFAAADKENGIGNQLLKFESCLDDNPMPVTLANSAALLSHPETKGAWVRPGIMLYGVSPFSNSKGSEHSLRPVMNLVSKIVATQLLDPGDLVGYGGAFRARKKMRIGIVACGYGDGYPRKFKNDAYVFIAGKLVRVLGIVSMDLMAIDLSDVPSAGYGSDVVLWGDDFPIEQVASAAGTIGYEILSGLSSRVPLIYA